MYLNFYHIIDQKVMGKNLKNETFNRKSAAWGELGLALAKKSDFS